MRKPKIRNVKLILLTKPIKNNANLDHVELKRCCVTNYLKFHSMYHFNPISLLYPITKCQ